MRGALFPVACVLLLAGAIDAQQPSQPQATFQSGVDVVQVDVSVLDKNRVPVRGLTAADFTVFENGKPRPIVAFTAIDLPERITAATTGWMSEVAPDVVTNAVPAEGRLLVIMLDRTVRPQSKLLARRIAGAAVDRLGPNDLAAVIYSGPGVPQNFTADRSLLMSAIDRPFTTLMEGDHGNPGECYCDICSLDAMTNAADVVRDVPQRRKSLLFIGDESGIVNWVYEPPINIDCRDDIRIARERLERAARTANLTIHAVDPRGLETGAMSAADRPEGITPAEFSSAKRLALTARLDTLRVLADTTNGRAVLNTNGPQDFMGTLLEETSAYYVLGFQSATSLSDGKLLPIDVKVNRRGISVQARRGHVAPTAPAVAAAGSTLAEAVKDLMPKTGLQLAMSAAPFASAAAERATVLISIGVRQAAVEPVPQRPEHIEILATAFDREGRSPGWQRQRLDVERVTGGSGLDYEAVARLDLVPGRYEIRVAAEHREAGRTGSVFAFVEVPDFVKTPVSLSGVVLESGSALFATPRDQFDDVIPAVPSARREFSRDETVGLFVRTYQGRGADLTPVVIRTRILDAASTTVFTDTTTLAADEYDAGRSADVRVDLPLSALAPGEHLLSIEATRGKDTARRDVRFRVR